MPAQLQAMMISEFELWLRSRTSKEKRPFHEETILANVSAITLFGSGDDHVTAPRRQLTRPVGQCGRLRRQGVVGENQPLAPDLVDDIDLGVTRV